ncbi:TPA: regulatory protein GemA [Pasteurella multocida]|uniref:gp16 family protein n=1 Tax=Pasteurella multocida TaxID=747 RepID=UPI0029A8E14F|nr:regulatory protein GemA [Pasteurella multocida]HEH9668994.1 regulatory protein GemA [Pasteurella multocida]HEH9696348.1 regulatory protein GemA [Pasteurella multocida]HEH9727297.1 regulatory protein GemA [Pasteurella multocida]HEH9752586.1 regulatory protein GemA [Pasteurella multocida]
MQSEKSRLIQLIKIGQKQLGMDDFSYRAMLQRLTNKTSSTKCTVVELHKVIHELKQKGAKITYFAKKRKNPTAYSPATDSQNVRSEIVHKIRAIWINMGKDGLLKDPSEKGLNHFMHSIINKNRPILVLNVQSLNQYDASRLLEILKKWHKRVMVERIEGKSGEKMPKKISYDNVVEYYKELFDEVM